MSIWKNIYPISLHFSWYTGWASHHNRTIASTRCVCCGSSVLQSSFKQGWFMCGLSGSVCALEFSRRNHSYWAWNSVQKEQLPPTYSEHCQTSVNYLCKTPHLRCLTGFLVHLCAEKTKSKFGMSMEVQLRRTDNLSSLFKNIRDSAIMLII